MRRIFHIILFSLFVICGFSQNSSYIEKLKRDVTELNNTLPKEYAEGLWLWSSAYSNKVVTITLKINQYYASFTKDVMDNMINEYSKAMVKLFGEEATSLAANGVSMKLRLQSMEDNHIIREMTITPDKISKYYIELKSTKSTDKGIRPLSYYQQGFTVASKNLPMNVDEYTTFFKVSMPNNIVYYDYYLDDMLADVIVSDTTGATKEEIKKETASSLAELITSQEMKSDLKTYNIQMCYRYYYRSNKKLAFQFTINPITYFKQK